MPAASDLDRMVFVTRAYPRMRAAIIAAPFGPFLIAFAHNLREADVPGAFRSGVLLLIAAPLSIHFVGRWLDRRFGKVVRSGELTPLQVFTPMLGGAAFSFVDKLDAWSLRSGRPSVLMLTLAACGLWMTIQDWPYRRHVLLFAVVCATYAGWLGAVAQGHELLRWRMHGDSAAILAWMSVGFFDLLMLRRVMPATDRVRQRSGT